MQDYLPILHHGIVTQTEKSQQFMEDYLPIMHCGIVTQTEAPTRYARLPTRSALWNE